MTSVCSKASLIYEVQNPKDTSFEFWLLLTIIICPLVEICKFCIVHLFGGYVHCLQSRV